MLLKYFYDRALAQASYMIGCQETGEALIIDPARDITPYLQAAQQENMRIVQVTETHIHADFVSGIREIAARTGARMYLSGMGDADWKYQFADANTVLLRDGDTWMLGNIKLSAIHTPGHTPEHLIFSVTDTKMATLPLALFTGDCLFVGDMGRPDLLEKAAGFANTAESGARGQFRNMQMLKALPDYLQVLPGHGAGSACGKALGAVPSSTLGYEKLFNPAFQFDDEAAFVAWLLADQPAPPRYFAQMKHVNKQGAPLIATLPEPQRTERYLLNDILRSEALVIDTRQQNMHVSCALHIQPTDSFSTYVGWFVNYDQPVYLICAPEQVHDLVGKLRAIGVDNIAGYFLPDEIDAYSKPLRVVDAGEAADLIRKGALTLDVRTESEFHDERIAGALNIPYTDLPKHMAELPKNRALLIHCQTGIRSQIAASLLERHNFTHFAHLDGGIDAWKAAGYPVEQD
ncbi:MAG: MBL fold metallo-hydrolase [Anaerolinea sp.]|nr:MBL fold metallo-hydrolase [Anaerolinea sp.]